MEKPSLNWRAQKLALLERVYRKIDKHHAWAAQIYYISLGVFLAGFSFFTLNSDLPYAGSIVQNLMVTVTSVSFVTLALLLVVLSILTPLRTWLLRMMERS